MFEELLHRVSVLVKSAILFAERAKSYLSLPSGGWVLCVLAAGALLHPGCARWRRPRSLPAATAPRPVPMGAVALVNVEEGFVLIDNGSLPPPEQGAVLRTYSGAVVSAELLATDVRRRPFIIADIKRGQPRKGDRVEMPRFLEPTAPAPASAPGEPRLPQ